MNSGPAVIVALVALLLAVLTTDRVAKLEKRHAAFCSRGVAVMTPDGNATAVCAP